MDPLLRLPGVSEVVRGAYEALKGVSFDLKAGEVTTSVGRERRREVGAHESSPEPSCPMRGRSKFAGNSSSGTIPSGTSLGIAAIFRRPALFPT